MSTWTRDRLDRHQVVAVARDVLVHEGVDGLSLRKLASKLGVTAPALYTHVASKDDLLRAIADQEFAEWLDELHQIGLGAGAPLTRLRRQASAYVSWALQHPALFRILFLTESWLVTEERHGADPLSDQALQAVIPTVAEAIEKGDLDATDPTAAAITLWTAVHGTAITLQAGMVDVDPDTLVHAVVETALSGLGPGQTNGAMTALAEAGAAAQEGAAVHDDGLSGDPARRVAAQEQRRAGDVIRLA